MSKLVLKDATVFIDGQDLSDHLTSLVITAAPPPPPPEPVWVRTTQYDDLERDLRCYCFASQDGYGVVIPVHGATMLSMEEPEIERMAMDLARREYQHMRSDVGYAERAIRWMRKTSPNPEVEEMILLDKQVREKSRGSHMVVADLNEDGSFTPRVVPA